MRKRTWRLLRPAALAAGVPNGVFVAETQVDIHRISMLQLTRGQIIFDQKRSIADFDLGEDGPKFESDLQVAGDIMSVDDQIIVHAKLTGREIAACSRCLTEIRQEYLRDFFLAFEVTKERFIDLLPHFREEMLLEQPLRVLCRPNCRGLCARCGADLNKKGTCTCADRS
jgi:uncharacterized protein